MFSGPHQQVPFLCTTARSNLGEPLGDNAGRLRHSGRPGGLERELPQRRARLSDGRSTVIVGWSKDCAGGPATSSTAIARRAATGPSTLADSPAAPPPADIAMTTTPWTGGHVFLHRALGARDHQPLHLQRRHARAPTSGPTRATARRLVVERPPGLQPAGRCRHRAHQGTPARAPCSRTRCCGWATRCLNSTGLRTNTHYNLQLGGETALMLKEHFVEDHGVPLYTVGSRRLRWRDPAVRLRAEPPGPARRRHSPVLLLGHGHADDPRWGLRAARALLRLDGPLQPEVERRAEPPRRPGAECEP